MKSDIVDLKMRKHAETEAAVLVSDDGEESNAIWLPKSQIEIEQEKDGFYLVTLPAWLAVEKGLV